MREAIGAEPPPFGWGLLAGLGAVAAGTLLVYPLKDVAPVVSLGIVYLPSVLLISTVWGWRLGLGTAVASALTFNFFHIPPTGRLAIAADRDGVALVVFAIVAVASSALAEMVRARAAEAERRRAEADRLLAELREAEAERDRMQAEAIEAAALRRSDELKTALLRAISHDLRTPLTAIIASGSALGSSSLTEEERTELSEAIVTGGDRLARLVENLLDMSRLEAGEAEPRREAVDLGEVIAAAGEGLEGTIRLAIDPELPLIDADAAQLERAFANLLENAVRYGGGRPVSVRSRQVGERVVVRIVDQGPGIPEPEQKRIFEPFRRGEGSAGSGLGLAIARGFVEANEGEIAIESVPGQGTSLVVSFRARQGAVR
jgi:two-component system sensor histidine kinase KdpD